MNRIFIALLICVSMLFAGCDIFNQYADVDKQIKAQLNDPDSYQRIEVVKNKSGLIRVKFRGNNAFGGKVINYCYGIPDKNGGYKMLKVEPKPNKDIDKHFEE